MIRIVHKVEDLHLKTTDKKHIKCVVYEEEKPLEQYEIILPVQEVELIETLNSLAKKLKIYPAMMNEIWSKITEYGSMRYNLGFDEGMLSNKAIDEQNETEKQASE